MPQIQIVPCTTKHLYTLQDIAINAYGDHYLYLWYDGGRWYIDKCFSDAALKIELEDTNAALFLVYTGEELVGFMKFNISKIFDKYTEQEALELERIYLLKTATGKGLGKALMDFTKQYAREKGKKVIGLKAMDSSRSVKFYEQNSFKKCGVETLDYEEMKPEFRGMHVLICHL